MSGFYYGYTFVLTRPYGKDIRWPNIILQRAS